MLSSPRYGVDAWARAFSMNRFTASASLRARGTLDAAGDVDAPWLHLTDGGSHVVGGETAGEDQLHRVGCVADERPVEHLAGARLGRIHEDHVGAVLIGPRQVGIIGPEGLDDPPDLLRHLDRLRRRFAPVQLDGLHAGLVGDRRPPATDARHGTPRRSGSPAGRRRVMS